MNYSNADEYLSDYELYEMQIRNSIQKRFSYFNITRTQFLLFYTKANCG